jgi:hypothetical protein
MDYNSEQIAKIINLYLMLAYNDVSYIRNEVRKFLENYLLPELKNDDDDEDDDEESSDISDLTRVLSTDCQDVVNNTSSHSKKEKSSFDIIFKEISSTAENVSNYNEKPLVCQLVCLWYIICSGQNDSQGKIVDLLKKKWKIKDDILAEMADTHATLIELRENSQKALTFVPQKSFLVNLKNLFRKNKMPERKQLLEDEYKNDEDVLLRSIKELFATEGLRD